MCWSPARWLIFIYEHVHRRYVFEYKVSDDPKARELATDTWEIRRIKSYFWFYITCLCYMLGFTLGTCAFLHQFTRNEQWNWFASCGMAWGFTYLIVWPLIAWAPWTNKYFAAKEKSCWHMTGIPGLFYCDYDFMVELENLYLD